MQQSDYYLLKGRVGGGNGRRGNIGVGSRRCSGNSMNQGNSIRRSACRGREGKWKPQEQGSKTFLSQHMIDICDSSIYLCRLYLYTILYIHKHAHTHIQSRIYMLYILKYIYYILIYILKYIFIQIYIKSTTHIYSSNSALNHTYSILSVNILQF